jgi:thymidylate kinase
MDKRIRHIVVEGTDGTGKTTLCNNICLWLQEQGQKATVVDKNNPELASVLSPILKKSTQYNMDITTYALLRSCREYHKTSFEFDGICIHDRSFISLRNVFEMYDVPIHLFEPIIQTIETNLAMSPIIFCDPGYEVARDRVELRAKIGEKTMGYRESLGQEYNERVYHKLRQEFENCTFDSKLKLTLDTSTNNPEANLEHVISFLQSL